MKKRQFKYGRANNFLCFGDEGIELEFSKMSNIVHIQGINQDAEADKNSSNGVGKSSVPEIPVYALFGKTIKRPTKLSQEDIIHNNGDKEMYVEFQWDDFRIVRTRKAGKGGKPSVRLWQSDQGIWNKDTEITVGGRGMQQQIEDKIGLNYQTFVNVYMFGDDSTHSFLECKTEIKREIVENLLSLEKYRTYHEVANNYLKDAKKQAKEALKDYEVQQQEVEAAKKRIEQINQQEKEWATIKQKEYDSLLDKIEKLKIRLTNSGHGQALLDYKQAQTKIAELNAKVPGLQSNRERVNELVAGAMPKFQQVVDEINNVGRVMAGIHSRLTMLDSEIERDGREIDNIRNSVGKECPFCKQEINESHSDSMIEALLAKIQKSRAERGEYEEQVNALNTKQQEIEASRCKMESLLSEARKKIQSIDGQVAEILAEISKLGKVKEPQAGVDELVIQREMETLTSQAEIKQAELESPSPFAIIRVEAEKEVHRREDICQKKRDQVLARDRDLPYLDFWTKAFGDHGIRKYVIDGIIPTLNKRIAHWLQFLVDSKIKLTLDNRLEEAVDRYPFDGRPYVYDGLSNGQRRRLMLALAQSFAYIMALNCGSCPSALFLDEVTMNMDEPGVEGIYRMICELSKERQVFVIDHNKSLLQKLSGCDTITLEMRNGITRRLK